MDVCIIVRQEAPHWDSISLKSSHVKKKEVRPILTGQRDPFLFQPSKAGGKKKQKGLGQELTNVGALSLRKKKTEGEVFSMQSWLSRISWTERVWALACLEEDVVYDSVGAEKQVRL